MEASVANERQITLSVNMNVADFGGVFSNGFEVFSAENEARVDFLYIDFAHINQETMEAPATIVSRVSMTAEKMLELRDILNRHIDSKLESFNA